ncbi:MAG TPA: EF-hand domain-containing protein [Rhodanobacteraceae bacterium]|nr:EF-hand domain-containing protein [Rhodanobacteraceae bacterium]
MRSVPVVFTSIVSIGFAVAAQAQNAPTANPPTQPATSSASKPAGQLGNSGGGLGMHMSPREARMAFQNMDTNRDGFLDRTEFMRNGDSGQRFAGCDTNRDGKLSEAEYVACSQRPPTQEQQQ